MKPQLPVIQKALDLSKDLIPRAAKFPKEYKYIFGDRLMGHVLNLQDILIQAAYSKNKMVFLDAANTILEQQLYRDGLIPLDRVRASVVSWVAHASYADSWRLRGDLIYTVAFQRGSA